MAKHSIDTVNDTIHTIAATNTKFFRSKLDSNIHVIDISKKALEVNRYENGQESKATITKAQYDSLYEKLLSAILVQVPHKFRGLDEVMPNVKTYILYYHHATLLVGPSYDAVQQIISKASKEPGLYKTIFGTLDNTPTGKTKLNIGHLPTRDFDYQTSPAAAKIEALISRAGKISNTWLKHQMEIYLQELYSVHISTESTFINKIDNFMDKLVSTVSLGEFIVVATIHTSKYNSGYLSKFEKEVVDKATKYITANISKLSGSNDMEEDIEQGIAHIIGTGKATLKKHTVRKSKTKSTTVKTSNAKVGTAGNIKLRTPGGQFISPISIQNLLNANLAQQIQRNMGKGNARTILNYRTGRFANSAEVTQVTSRDGAVNVFYQYMKNPYATFAPGGAQGSPTSRDPNLLIQKSIRQLAQGIVTNRLKVVPQ